MSENAPPSPVPPPPPGGKSPTTPLKKETVRITLRAKPGEGLPAEGVAPISPTAPLRPPAPLPPGVTRPAAPPPPVGGVGSRTIPLTPPGPRPVAPAAGPSAPARPAATAPLGGGGAAPAQQLSPQPTIRLQAQRPAPAAAAAVSSAPHKPAAFDDEEAETDDKGLNLLAGIAVGLAAIFLLISVFGYDKNPLGVAEDPTNPGWKLPRPALKPAEEDFARQTADGWQSAWKIEEIPTDPIN